MTLNRRSVMAGGLGLLIAPALGTPSRAQGVAHEVAIRDFVFDPGHLRVAVGDRIRFTNHDLVPHTATAQDGSWDTGTLEQDQSAELLVTPEWTGSYFCAYHPSMIADLEITG
ncbi:copper-binding protein [Roseovarius sp. CAU 1744]|uniref:copper-binding protein n=1 Tax=Roseovarius sp. CAU 1744 TaxID=3140368 RepID=UPI00325BE99B